MTLQNKKIPNPAYFKHSNVRSPDTVDDLGLELSLVPLNMLLPRLLILHLSSTFFLCGSRGEEKKSKNSEV